MIERRGKVLEEAPAGCTLVLAMDTSGRIGSVAVGFWPTESRAGNGVVLGRRSLEEREEHASLLLPRIQDLLEEVGVGPADLSGLAVGAGPGSFTGVRVGVATAKGMARALRLPLWGFSSLAAAAVGPWGFSGSGPDTREVGGLEEDPSLASDPMRPRCVLFDARGDRLYAAAFRISGEGVEVLLEPRASTVGEMCEGLIPPGAVLMGDGAIRHQADFQQSGFDVLSPPAGVPTAEGLIRLLTLDPLARPLGDPGRWEPEYLRASGAARMHRSPPEPSS
jgi:tRNA threonylcarbamoyladenosine biosynthesis protein TsaB